MQWALPALAACRGPQSMLDPAGPGARDVTLLWWPMLAVATLVLGGVTLLWILALRRRRRDSAGEDEGRIARRFIVGGGLLLPGASITLLLAFGIPVGQRMLSETGRPPLRIDVTARQWGWEVSYPGTGVVLHDALHLPAGRPVEIRLASADVIHSFWVPGLGRKLDVVPGRINVLRLQAERTGSLRGQCAEFCGPGHAHMVLRVEVMELADFGAWLQKRAGAP